jgi:hypothetical protein
MPDLSAAGPIDSKALVTAIAPIAAEQLYEMILGRLIARASTLINPWEKLAVALVVNLAKDPTVRQEETALLAEVIVKNLGVA